MLNSVRFGAILIETGSRSTESGVRLVVVGFRERTQFVELVNKKASRETGRVSETRQNDSS